MSTRQWADRANALRHDDAPAPQGPTRSEVRVGGSSAGIQQVTVHSVPGDDSFWINVRRIERNDSDPYDGGWQFVGDPFPMNCWGKSRGRHFRIFEYDGDDPAHYKAQVHEATFINGAWEVKPIYVFRAIEVETPMRVMDCYPSGAF